MLLDVCLSKGVLEIIRIAKIIMNIISIVAPLLLMFSIMFKFIKAIYHKDNDAFEQAKRNIVSNVKVLLLLFIIISIALFIVQYLLLSFFSGSFLSKFKSFTILSISTL